jgi:hypothetical protein
MKRALLFLMIVACNKTDTQTTTTSSASPSASANKAPPAPFTGALTGDRVMGSKGLVHPFDKWDDAQAKLEGQMGKETFTKGDNHTWAVSQGDDCWYTVVEKQKDGTVGMVQDPMKVSKGGPIMNLDDCLTAAGVRKEAAEDPNAPGPPVDGKPIALAKLMDVAPKARSKWTGAKINVAALYLNATTSTSGDKTYKTLSLVATKDGDAYKHSVGCSLADPNAALPKLVQYDPITVSGTVKVDDMMSLAGAHSLSVSLGDCVVKGK